MLKFDAPESHSLNQAAQLRLQTSLIYLDTFHLLLKTAQNVVVHSVSLPVNIKCVRRLQIEAGDDVKDFISISRAHNLQSLASGEMLNSRQKTVHRAFEKPEAF